jgi:transposase
MLTLIVIPRRTPSGRCSDISPHQINSGDYREVISVKGVQEKRPNYPREFKAELAAKACESGVSVSKLAVQNGINTNMLFKWRRQYRAGELRVPARNEQAAELVAVSIVQQEVAPLVALPNPATRVGGAAAGKPEQSVIEIKVAHAVVCVEGDVDVVRLRAILSALRA